ncbi:MAG: SpoIVB peptidase [Lachnospiraceae bacterium]
MKQVVKISVIVGICLAFGLWIYITWNNIPNTIHFKSKTEQQIMLNVPATGKIYEEQVIETIATENQKEIKSIDVNLNHEISFYGIEEKTYKMDILLFGIIPFKSTTLSVVEDTFLTPAGTPIGIYVKTQGVLVIDTGSFKNTRGENVSPAGHLLKAGDYIIKVNDMEIENKAEFIEIIDTSNGTDLILTIKRGDESFDIRITPQLNQNNEYKIGIWIRDNAQGIGTLTFVDEHYNFGALGHGINDLDTSTLMEVENGALYKTRIVGITKGETGSPGELTGMIAYSSDNKMGDILYNARTGIYGTIDSGSVLLISNPLQVALKQEIELGKAQIICTIDETPKYYDIEIIAINIGNDNINRELEIKITDQELLNKTGGIVQGMSGSPIIQNNKIVGAITHVLVQDPTKGYGIFIESMLNGQ